MSGQCTLKLRQQCSYHQHIECHKESWTSTVRKGKEKRETNQVVIILKCVCKKMYRKVSDLIRLKTAAGASLVAQWLRICLPMQGTRVRALVWEDPTCRGATRPVSHNY